MLPQTGVKIINHLWFSATNLFIIGIKSTNMGDREKGIHMRQHLRAYLVLLMGSLRARQRASIQPQWLAMLIQWLRSLFFSQ